MARSRYESNCSSSLSDDFSGGSTSANRSPSQHKLAHSWTLYVWISDVVKSWSECIHKQVTISTVEEFWALNYRIVQPSLLNLGTDYMLFKAGIQPMWEDSANAAGGVWYINVERQFKYTKSDRYWLELLMLMLGGQFDELNGLINGAIYNQRSRGAKICVWTAELTAKQRAEMREMLDTKLSLSMNDRLYYQKHSFK